MVTVESLLPGAAADRVWARVSTAEGINAELAPVLRMRMPRQLRGWTLDEVPLGVRLGRAWVLVGGIVPVDFDDLVLAERTTGQRFLERSSTSSCQVWQHERIVTETPDGVSVRDTVTYRLRPPWRPARGGYRRGVTALFRHRHDRLRRQFAAENTPTTTD